MGRPSPARRPSIRRDLGASPVELEWFVAGPGLTFAVLLITGGRIGDRIGRRRAFCIGGVNLRGGFSCVRPCPNAWRPDRGAAGASWLAVLPDGDGFVIEGAGFNVFAVTGGGLYTPARGVLLASPALPC